MQIMPLEPKFIYFDLDDTLLDHQKAEQQALRDICDYFDLFADAQTDHLIEVYHRINSRQWLLYGQGKVNRKQLQYNRFHLTLKEMNLDDSRSEKVGAKYMNCYQNHWQWMNGARQAFQQIRDKYAVGVLTNGFAETQKKKFAQFDLYNLAKHLVISEETGAMKPDPAVFEYATDLTGYEPEDILYIGDSYTSDVIGGTTFGWNVAWFTQNDEAEKREKADFVFSDFKDLMNLLMV